MKWMIASDIHGSAFYCEKMLKAFEREQADKLLLLGDILYHGPRNDLPKGYAPKKVIELLNNIKEKILCVRGNCDAEVDQMVLEFPIMADYAMITEGDLNIFCYQKNKKLSDLSAEGIFTYGEDDISQEKILASPQAEDKAERTAFRMLSRLVAEKGKPLSSFWDSYRTAVLYRDDFE